MRSLFALREDHRKEPRSHDMIKQVRLGPLACELYRSRNQWRVGHGDTGQQSCRDVGLCFQVNCTHLTLSSVVSAFGLETEPISPTQSWGPSKLPPAPFHH